MDYNDVAQTLNELNWRFTQMIIGLSFGIIAFSIQTISKDAGYSCLAILYISWICFSLSVILGLLRLHQITKATAKSAMIFFRTDVKKEKYNYDEKADERRNKRTAIIYRIMMIFFIVGLICFGYFKVVNI